MPILLERSFWDLGCDAFCSWKSLGTRVKVVNLIPVRSGKFDAAPCPSISFTYCKMNPYFHYFKMRHQRMHQRPQVAAKGGGTDAATAKRKALDAAPRHMMALSRLITHCRCTIQLCHVVPVCKMVKDTRFQANHSLEVSPV